jgi:hypothetical protein
VVASLVAGVVSGLLARVAMSILGAAGGSSLMAVVGRLTVEGTIRIVVVPVVFGIPFAAILLAIGRRWGGGPTIVRSVAYGIGALVLPGLLFLTDSEFHIPGPNGSLGPWLFAIVFLVYGALVGLVGEWVLGRTSGRTVTP